VSLQIIISQVASIASVSHCAWLGKKQKDRKKLGTIIPATLELTSGGLPSDQPKQKVCKTPYQWKEAGDGGMCLSSQQWQKA
jgi:hypothetical protein